MEDHLQDLLKAALSFPVAWGNMGRGVSTPRASVYRVGGLRDMTLQGPGLMLGRLQVDCYGKTFAEADAARKEVCATLEDYAGGPVQGVFLEAIRDGFEGDAQLLQRVSLTFSVTYRD
ncbi:MAG: hypothetical protein KI788_17985 [Mameliella sp.]|nr:hypothetical protein [Mameliella sp.]